MTKQIKLSELKADINAGMKREALRVKYTDGNNNQLNLILKQAGLKIRSFKVNPLKPKFELVDDTIEESTIVEMGVEELTAKLETTEV